MKTYYVYVMSNTHRTVLYIGMTNDLGRRVAEHKSGQGSAFASKYRTTDLVYYEEYGQVRDAIAREKQLKKWRREKKDCLIRQRNPELIDLADEEAPAHEVVRNRRPGSAAAHA